MNVQEFDECADIVRSMVETHHRLHTALDDLELSYALEHELAVYVPEGEFVDQNGETTSEGIAGHNNLIAVSEELALVHLALPTIETFLASRANDEPGREPERFFRP